MTQPIFLVGISNCHQWEIIIVVEQPDYSSLYAFHQRLGVEVFEQVLP